MKVKVKGLVFVGFAAAILSANAMAADNTVTSKSYVDNKFQTIENIETEYTATNKNSTTEYPAMSALTQALSENGGVVNDSRVSVTQNGASIGSFSTNQATGSTLAIAGADWNAASGTAGFIANKPTVDTTFNAASTNAATSAAIADYVTNTVKAEENVQANWTETDTTSDAYIQNKPTALSQFTDDIGDQKTANMSSNMTTDTGSTTKYPSVAAVEDYITNTVKAEENVQADWTETDTDNDAYIQNKPTALSQFTDDIDARNAIDSITVGGAAVAPDSNKAVALGAAAGKGADTSITSSATDNNVPTSKAVYDYVDGLPAADIPAMPTQADDPTGYCDAAHPCALVTDETTGQPVWKRIAQATDNVGD